MESLLFSKSEFHSSAGVKKWSNFNRTKMYSKAELIIIIFNKNNCWHLPRKLHSLESGLREVLHPIELEFENVDFCGEAKTREPGEKPLGAE